MTRTDLQRPGIAIIGNMPNTQQMLARRLDDDIDARLSYTASEAGATSADIAQWLDAAARHPETRAIGLLLDLPEIEGALRDLIAEVAWALPTAKLRGPETSASLLESWWKEQGVPSYDDPFALLRGLRGVASLDRYPSQGFALRADDRELEALLERMLHGAGLVRATSDTGAVLLLAQHAQKLIAHEQDHSRGSGEGLALDIEALLPGLELLRRWEEWKASSQPTTETFTDTTALRRIIAERKRLPGSEDSTRERLDKLHRLLRSLGIGIAPMSWVHYPEDALIAAARLGYPVELFLAGSPPHARAVRRANGSVALQRIAEDMLRAGRQNDAAPLVVCEAVDMPPRILIEVLGDARPAPAVRMQRGDSVLHTFGQPDGRDVERMLDAPNLPEGLRHSMIDSLGRIVRRLLASPDVHGVFPGLQLSVRPTASGEMVAQQVGISAGEEVR